jgi:thymidylate synthase
MDYSTLGEAWVGSMDQILSQGQWQKDGERNLLEKRNLGLRIISVSAADPIIVRYADQERILLMKKKHESLCIIDPFVVSYGQALYSNMGINQVDHLINRLKEKRETKAATISLHNPGETYSTCLSLLDCKIRNNSLDLTAVYRSQNTYGSQPGNILALSSVHKHIATSTDSQLGAFNLYVISAHIYEEDVADARSIVTEVIRDGK